MSAVGSTNLSTYLRTMTDKKGVAEKLLQTGAVQLRLKSLHLGKRMEKPYLLR
jgi:hypothetical protein